MSVANGAAEAVVMPGVHRALSIGCVTSFSDKLYSRSLTSVTVLTFLISSIAWVWHKNINFLIIVFAVPIPIIATLSALNQAFLTSKEKFLTASLGPTYGSLLAIPMVFFLPVNAYSLIFSLLLFEAGRYIGLKIHNSKHPFPIQKGHEVAAIKTLEWVWKNAKYQALGSLFGASNLVVDMFFAKKLSIGSVSLVEYANRLWNIVPLFFFGILVIMYSQWSRLGVKNGPSTDVVRRKALHLGGIALIVGIIVAAGAENIIDLLFFGRGLDFSAKKNLSLLLATYMPGAAFFVTSLVVLRAYNVAGRLDIVVRAAGFSVAVNIILDAVLVNKFGLLGIGTATSITHFIITIFLIAQLSKIKKSSQTLPYDHS